MICFCAKYADAHSGKGMIPEWVPIFEVFLDSLNPVHTGRFATSTAPPWSPSGRSAMSLRTVRYASFAAHAIRLAGANSVRQTVRAGRVSLPCENLEYHYVFRPS